MSQLLTTVREKVRTKGMAYKTEKAYVGWIERYVVFCREPGGKWRHPMDLGAEQVEAYLTHLAVKKNVSASTQNQALAALLFLYRDVLEKDIDGVDALRAKGTKWLPTVLSVPETRRLLSHLNGTYSIIGGLLYGCGLRLMEALRLRVKDVDFDRKQITLRDTKSNRDRAVPLPETVAEPLRKHMALVRAQWEIDLGNGHGDVELPNALDKKYPNAAREWGWQYVFPASKLSTDPRSGAIRKHHLYETSVQKAVSKAAKMAGIDKPTGPHTLRHSYATHLAERGEPIEVISKLLGHKDIRTTMIYLHLADRKPRSPLDDL
jgi:integron integrase